jgi:hypothetical protein
MQMVSSLAKDMRVALTNLFAKRITTKRVAKATPAARIKSLLRLLKRKPAAKTNTNYLCVGLY